MSVINTNIPSLNAQRNLASSSGGLATSLQRLSSGLRINSAKDDAAGLAISERMTSQIRGLTQAARNANDGISLAQIAEGALGEVGNNLQRIRELAVQSRNDSNSQEDRDALQKEVTQLKAEIGRVAKDTQFNKINLLDGSFTSKSFQVGANQGQTIDIAQLANASISALGSWEIAGTPTTSGKSGAFANVTLADSSKTYSLTVGTVPIFTASGTGTAGGTGATAPAAMTVTANAIDTQLADSTVKANLVKAGITVSGSAANGDLVFSKADGTSMAIAVVNGAAAGGFTAPGSDFGGTGTTKTNGVAGTTQTGFANLDVSTAAGADNAMLAMDGALKAVNSARADLGAVQNRFASVVSNVQTTTENLSASRSRIRDTDFAAETANMTRNQILQQAGTAMLAQANQLPYGVLALLRA